MKSFNKKILLLVVSLVMISILAVGCAAASPEEAVYDSYAEMPAAEMGVFEEERASTSMAPSAEGVPLVEQKIIKTAYMEVEVGRGTFDEKLFSAMQIAQKYNGFVSNTQSYSDSEGKMTNGYVTIRVPAGSFDNAIEDIKNLGTVKSTQVSGQDVTQEYVDLESRLNNFQVQEEIVLGLMEESRTVTDSIEVQKELSYVQGEIEVIKGRMRYLESMVSFSTIDINIFETLPIETSGFLDALRRGLQGAIRLLNGLVYLIIAASPIFVLITLIIIIIWLSLRSRNKRRAAKNAKRSENEKI